MATYQRKELILEMKNELANALKNKTNTKQEMQKSFNINPPQMLTSDADKRKRRPRAANNRHVDEAVTKWYHEMQKHNIFVNGPMLRRQAEKFARMMNNFTFQANNGWLWRWQNREKVKFKPKYYDVHPKLKTKAMDSQGIETYVHNVFGKNNESVDNLTYHREQQQQQQQEQEHNAVAFSVIEIDEGTSENENALGVDVLLEQNNADEQRNRNDELEDIEGITNEHRLRSHDFMKQKQHGEYPAYQESLPDMRFVDIKPEPEEFFEANHNEMQEVILPQCDEEPPAKKRQMTYDGMPANVRDNYSVYGEHIAHRLRGCEREKYEIYIAQRNIDEIMFKLSMGSYARKPQHHMTENNIDNTTQTTDAITPTSTPKPKEEPSDFTEFVPVVIPGLNSKQPHNVNGFYSSVPNAID